MIHRIALFGICALIALAVAAPAGAIGPPCALTPKTKCFGIETLSASLSATEPKKFSANQAGAHSDLSFSFAIKQNPESTPDSKGTHNVYAPIRNVRFVAPTGLIGDPSVLGVPEQCTPVELSAEHCPNGSQIGVTTLNIYKFNSFPKEPIYMMSPPGGDVVARVGFIAAGIPIYSDFTVRSESDYSLIGEITDAATAANVVGASVTIWGVPSAEKHDRERCTPSEVFKEGCTESPIRKPGTRELPFLTNPTRCGVPLALEVNASSWVEPEFDPAKAAKAAFPEIEGCNRLPFGPDLTIEPTSHRAAAPTGLDITARLAPSDGVQVLEPSQTRDVKVALPAGVTVNSSAANGLDVCSERQVHFGERVAAECPDAAKVAEFEADIPALPRRLKGAVYLREPEPGNLFRVWVVADDLGAHVKLEGQLVVDERTGQIKTVIPDTPQAPLREVKIVLKSGFRAPLVNPNSCGTFASQYEFTPWSGGLPKIAGAPMTISEGCNTGGFAPKLSAGSVDPTGGAHSPFVFTLTREDGEQNPASLNVLLPKGLSATLAGVARCEGTGAITGQCPEGSRIGRIIAAAGAGPAPLWVPQPGKRPTAVYLGGPYKGAPLSVIAVVPAQAGPFDLGDQVVRSAISLDPVTAQGSVRSDSLPQILEGVPILYRTVQIELDRKGFTLNPTGCTPRSIKATVASTQGAVASPSSPFTVTNCARLPFKPSLSLRLLGGTHRGSHPKLKATLKMPPGGANIGTASVALPHSEFLDQAHIKTVCTRVQFAAHTCPAGSIYGYATAKSPLLDERLQGTVYLRSSSHALPDTVVLLKGPPSLPIEVELAGRVDSVNGGIRSTFETAPDAPVSEFNLTLQGGKKGLIINSTNLCTSTNRATAKFTGQNGKKLTLHPELKASCKQAKPKN